MKRIAIFVFMGLTVMATSCKKYLDVNDNPNSATSATPELILPQALTGTASNVNGFNSYGSQLVGYMANAGGFGGFGTSITYNFSAGDFPGRWSTTYDNLEDYQIIINQTDKDLPTYSYFNAVARIMKAYNFQLLVDTYNDVPYSEALKGVDQLTTKYDDAKSIYADLAVELDKAITTINEAMNAQGVTIKDLGVADVLFGGDMENWIKFANTIKLRLIVRAAGKVNFANTTFDAHGFLAEDALINPGYRHDVSRQNPQWESWAFTSTGGAGNKAWMPNTFVMGYYDGAKLSDSWRGKAIYYKYPSTGSNRLGHEGNDIPSSPTGSFWYPGTDRNPGSAGNSTGVLKGPDAGYPVFLAAESYFLQSEAVLRNILTSGSVKDLFKKGIEASYTYLYTKPDGAISGSPLEDVAAYTAANKASYLVNFDLANTAEKKVEAIITQKYIALNFIHGHEAWNEYRRTHYPKVISGQGVSGYETFASTVSESTQPDKLPTRILYPSSEGAYNSANVPKNISPFTSFIFWALQ